MFERAVVAVNGDRLLPKNSSIFAVTLPRFAATLPTRLSLTQQALSSPLLLSSLSPFLRSSFL